MVSFDAFCVVFRVCIDLSTLRNSPVLLGLVEVSKVLRQKLLGGGQSPPAKYWGTMSPVPYLLTPMIRSVLLRDRFMV